MYLINSYPMTISRHKHPELFTEEAQSKMLWGLPSKSANEHTVCQAPVSQ